MKKTSFCLFRSAFCGNAPRIDRLGVLLFPLILASASLAATPSLPGPDVCLPEGRIAPRDAEAECELDALAVTTQSYAEAHGVVEAFRETREPNTASSPSRLTLLHLACIHQKPALVRLLLAAGADPNAQRLIPPSSSGHKEAPPPDFFTPGDRPLASLFRPLPGKSLPDDATAIAIIDMLAAAGADMRGEDAAHALCRCESEPVRLHLLLLGADVGRLSARDAVAERHQFFLNCALAGQLRVMEFMLQRGMVSVYGTADVESLTVLGFLCRNLARAEADCPYFDKQARAIALLLRHGADTRFAGLADLDELQSSPADYIHDNPRLLAHLQAEGLRVLHTCRRLRPEYLEADIAALPDPVHPRLLEDEVDELWPLMADLLGNPAMNATGRLARHRCLELMEQMDAARTREFVMAQLPLWQDGNPGRADMHGHVRDVMEALRRATGLRLPAEWLLATAERMQEAGCPRAAHDLVQLLGRNGADAALIGKLCDHKAPAISAAAWGLRARLNRLPQSWEEAFAEGSEARRQAEDIDDILHALGSDLSDNPRPLDFTRGNAGRLNGYGDKMGVLAELLEAQGEAAVADYLRALSATQQHLEELPRDAGDEVRGQLEARLEQLLVPDNTEPAAFAIERALAKWVCEHPSGLQPAK